MGYGAPVYACVGAGDVPSGRGDSGGSEDGQTGRHTFDSLFTESFFAKIRTYLVLQLYCKLANPAECQKDMLRAAER